MQYVKRAYAERLFAATSGNLSIYDREAGRMYITPSSYPYEIMTTEDVMVIDLEGNILEGKHRPSSEWKLHAALYRANADVGAVVHTHSPYATSFAINNMAIPPVLYEIIYYIGPSIPVAKGALPGTPAVGENCVLAMGDCHGCLMGNHGAVAVGSTLDNAYTRAVYIEDAAKAYALALANGPVKVIDSIEVAKMPRMAR